MGNVVQEGPNPQPMITISTNANTRDVLPVTDIDENRMQQYDLLQKQIQNGLYDGDGPADVAPIPQSK